MAYQLKTPGRDVKQVAADLHPTMKACGFSANLAVNSRSHTISAQHLRFSRASQLDRGINTKGTRLYYRHDPFSLRVECVYRFETLIRRLHKKWKGKIVLPFPEVDIKVRCGNAMHRILVTQSGKFVLCDHSKDEYETELVMAKLGSGDLPRCLALKRVWLTKGPINGSGHHFQDGMVNSNMPTSLYRAYLEKKRRDDLRARLKKDTPKDIKWHV